MKFLAHLSWKLKWAFLIAWPPSFVRPSACLSVCLSVCMSTLHLHLLLQNHWANFTKHGTKHPWAIYKYGPFSFHKWDSAWVFYLLINVIWYNHLCLLICTSFSGERCGPLASCLKIFLSGLRYGLIDFFSTWCKPTRISSGNVYGTTE